MKLALFVALGVFGVLYVAVLARAVLRARRAGKGQEVKPTFFETALGFVTSFFDTLGIGSFAPTTAVLKLRNLVADEKIPGTLNVGHTLATLAQAYIFIAIVQVDMTTLVLMIVAACLGSWLGAGFVSRASRRKIQIGMGLALLAAATLFLLQIFEVTPPSGNTEGLAGWRLGVGFAGNFVLGALMEVGVGLYGPCMILVSLLGLNLKAAFPIMMGSCAFLMPVGSVKFIRGERYSLRATLGLALGGVPAVLLAAFIVKSLPLYYMRWLVVFVVLYAALSMLRSAVVEARKAAVLQHSLSEGTWRRTSMVDERRNPNTTMIGGGVVLIILGLVIFLWAKEHSPYMGFGQMLMRLDSWVFKPVVYNVVLVICALLGLLGMVSLVRGLQGGTGAVLKSEALHPLAAKTNCDNCGKLFASHFYLERASDGKYLCEECRHGA